MCMHLGGTHAWVLVQETFGGVWRPPPSFVDTEHCSQLADFVTKYFGEATGFLIIILETIVFSKNISQRMNSDLRKSTTFLAQSSSTGVLLHEKRPAAGKVYLVLFSQTEQRIQRHRDTMDWILFLVLFSQTVLLQPGLCMSS